MLGIRQLYTAPHVNTLAYPSPVGLRMRRHLLSGGARLNLESEHCQNVILLNEIIKLPYFE